MNWKNKNWFGKKSRGFIIPVLLLAIWFIASGLNIRELEHFISAPQKVCDALIYLIKSGDLTFNLRKSITRVLYGFSLGMSAGFILGTLMGLFKLIEKLFNPLFNVIRQIPLLGWVPLIILWCGIGETSKIVFISVSAFYPMVLNTFAGIRNVKKEYVEVGKVFEFNQIQLLRKIIFPSALPSVFTGVRFSLSISWMMVVGAELFTSSAGGIGNMMSEAREQFRTDIVILGIIIIGVIGLVMNQVLGLIEMSLLRWKKSLH
jgi:sulfonate transport system permease protein